MNIKTFQAATMHEALEMVRRELGSDAALLRTREVQRRWLRWLPCRRRIEVTASRDVDVPSRLPSRIRVEKTAARPHERIVKDKKTTDEVQGQLDTLKAMMQELCQRTQSNGRDHWPDGYFQLFTDLIAAGLGKELARELIEDLRRDPQAAGLVDTASLKARLASLVEKDIRISGPIAVTPGRCRLAALVGPTGVGKTTTIAKLAANFRLREKRRVGLITVDTYRIAAVEQLRTYADIIDLPMQVVSTPREMRETVERMGHLDLILLDTAGRSPRDEVRIQELQAFLTEAQANEVHLVLSAVATRRTLELMAERFAAVGATSLILTKLDEAGGLGNVLPLVRNGRLPLSYLTDGQNVPDDIQTADARRLTQRILGVDFSEEQSVCKTMENVMSKTMEGVYSGR